MTINLREELGDDFAARVIRGGQNSLFMKPCSQMDREELLVTISYACEQIDLLNYDRASREDMNTMLSRIFAPKGVTP